MPGISDPALDRRHQTDRPAEHPPDRPADFLKEGLELLGEQKESEEHGKKHPEGKTPGELAKDLEKALSEYVRNPTVSVMVTSFVGAYSDQIRVVGQAAKPQSLPFRANMTLLDVMIAVGGLAEFASGNRAILVRNENGKQLRIPVRLRDLLSDGDITANMPMRPGDVLIIPESRF